MDKTINTTLIIGNGFDLSMGKHTSYMTIALYRYQA